MLKHFVSINYNPCFIILLNEYVGVAGGGRCDDYGDGCSEGCYIKQEGS